MSVMMIDCDKVEIECCQPREAEKNVCGTKVILWGQLLYSPINFDEQMLQPQFEKGTVTRCPDHKINYKSSLPGWEEVLRVKVFSYGGQWKQMTGPAVALRPDTTAKVKSTYSFLFICMCIVCAHVYACVHSCGGQRLMSHAFPLSVTTFLFETMLLIESEVQFD